MLKDPAEESFDATARDDQHKYDGRSYPWLEALRAGGACESALHGAYLPIRCVQKFSTQMCSDGGWCAEDGDL